jgi:hypothetical protein
MTTLSIRIYVLVIVLSVAFTYCYAECHYAACRYAECHCVLSMGFYASQRNLAKFQKFKITFESRWSLPRMIS